MRYGGEEDESTLRKQRERPTGLSSSAIAWCGREKKETPVHGAGEKKLDGGPVDEERQA